MFQVLGVHFDTRLTWSEHVRSIVDKSKKVINVMRCLAGLEWGADVVSMKYIYVALVRARIDYGCVVYGSAVVQARALRLCLGAVKSALVCALQVEAGEMPLRLRRRAADVPFIGLI